MELCYLFELNYDPAVKKVLEFIEELCTGKPSSLNKKKLYNALRRHADEEAIIMNLSESRIYEFTTVDVPESTDVEIENQDPADDQEPPNPDDD